MPTYLVWDELNGEREAAVEIAAASAEDAAKTYAERDHDGLCDGLYTEHPQPIMVEQVDLPRRKAARRFHVRGETDVVFYAVEEMP